MKGTTPGFHALPRQPLHTCIGKLASIPCSYFCVNWAMGDIWRHAEGQSTSFDDVRCTFFIARVCRPWLLRICFRLSNLANKPGQTNSTPHFVARSFVALSQLLRFLPHVSANAPIVCSALLHRNRVNIITFLSLQ